MLSLINKIKKTEKYEIRRKNKQTKFRLVCYHVFLLFHQKVKMVLWSYGQYAHSGIRVQPKTKKNDKLGKRAISLKNDSQDSKADFSQE